MTGITHNVLFFPFFNESTFPRFITVLFNCNLVKPAKLQTNGAITELSVDAYIVPNFKPMIGNSENVESENEKADVNAKVILFVMLS